MSVVMRRFMVGIGDGAATLVTYREFHAPYHRFEASVFNNGIRGHGDTMEEATASLRARLHQVAEAIATSHRIEHAFPLLEDVP